MPWSRLKVTSLAMLNPPAPNCKRELNHKEHQGHEKDTRKTLEGADSRLHSPLLFRWFFFVFFVSFLVPLKKSWRWFAPVFGLTDEAVTNPLVPEGHLP
jgi:hypothetical protein